MNLTEHEDERIIAIAAAIDTGEYDVESSLDELTELARTADAEIAARVVQKRPSPDAATVLGEGKIEELAELAESLEAKLIIFAGLTLIHNPFEVKAYLEDLTDNSERINYLLPRIGFGVEIGFDL